MGKRSVCLIAVALACGAGSAAAEPGPDELGRELSRLRLEVEELSVRIDEERAEARARLQSQAARRGDLELEVQREELRLTQVERALEERRAQTEAAREREKLLVPVVQQGADALAAAIREGLPFRPAEREREVREVTDRLADGLLEPADALARLWDRVEDELRLTRESGIYSQVITLRGEEVLAEVLRVGMVMMFFRAPSGQMGAATRRQDGWEMRPFAGEADGQRVADLFDGFKKQLRTGFYEIPNALPEVTRD